MWRKCDSLIVSSICGYEALEGERVNMYRSMFMKKSSKSNKRENFFCVRWPRWGQYQYWHWHCQVHVLHEANLIKMYWWQKAYQTQNVLLHRLVCLTKVTPIFFHNATAKFISGLAKFYIDSQDWSIQIYWTFDMLLIIKKKKKKDVSFLRNQGCLFLSHINKMC